MKLGNKLKRIIRTDAESFSVEVEFHGGEKGRIGLAFLFENPGRKNLVKEILRGGMFGKCFVENGALAWSNGYELCPDALHEWMLAQRKKRAA